MKRKFSTREKALLLILTALVLICMYFLMVHQPVRTTMSEAAIREENAKSNQLIETAKLGRMRKMERALEELAEDAKADVPDYDNARNVVHLLNDALSAADTYNLNFRAVTWEGEIACRNIDMSYTCGSYETAKDILDVLYRGPYRCEITAVSMSEHDDLPRGSIPSLGVGSVSVKASVCFYEFAPETADETEKVKK